MAIEIPERKRKEGVCYAVTREGVELPVVDITHPAFNLGPEETDVLAVRRKYEAEVARWSRHPAWVQRFLFFLGRRNSLVLQGLAQGKDTFLSGMNTYLLKLGPANLGDGYAKRLDRRVAAQSMAVNVRVRLQNMAESIAEGLAPALERGGKEPILLLNIAGGSAMDSLNALILLHKRKPGLLTRRAIGIRVLDADPVAPAFGERALRALQAAGGPLEGVEAALEYVSYDWRRPSRLAAAADASALWGIQVGSSEGGLFEYGTEREIQGNLEALRECTNPEFTLSASVLTDGATVREMNHLPRLAVRCLPLNALHRLVAKAGWKVDRLLEGPVSDVMRLRKL